MLPDAIESFPSESAYPWPYLTACSAFLLLLSIEKVLVPRISALASRDTQYHAIQISTEDDSLVCEYNIMDSEFAVLGKA